MAIDNRFQSKKKNNEMKKQIGYRVKQQEK